MHPVWGVTTASVTVQVLHAWCTDVLIAALCFYARLILCRRSTDAAEAASSSYKVLLLETVWTWPAVLRQFNCARPDSS